jgi:hypothetical protein
VTSSGPSITDLIGAEYDLEDGFVGRLRSGRYDPAGADRLLAALSALDLGDGPVDRRLVSLLWYLPLIIGWQLHRVPAEDIGKVENILNQVVGILETVLGVP